MNLWEDNPELIDGLKTLHATGLSFSQIAAQLGHGLTRNSCIGKAKRLGLARRGVSNDPNKPKVARPTRLYKQSRPRRQRSTAIFDYYDFDPLPCELPGAVIPLAQRKTLLELKPHHCRYIYGDPSSGDFFYCGGDKYAGSYCAYHHGITHRGTAQITDFERERRRQFRINSHRIETEKERLAV